jgi:hypothetical protein
MVTTNMIKCISMLIILPRIKSSFLRPRFSTLQRIIFSGVALKLLGSTQEYVHDDQDMRR